MADPKTGFCLTRAKDGEFRALSGYRDWFEIRDLGLADATNDQYDAYITRARELGGKGGRHYHEYEFQVLYVLKGWVKMWYEGEGEFTLAAGDFVYHPPRHVHEVVNYSEDVEILEIASPKLRAAISV